MQFPKKLTYDEICELVAQHGFVVHQKELDLLSDYSYVYTIGNPLNGLPDLIFFFPKDMAAPIPLLGTLRKRMFVNKEQYEALDGYVEVVPGLGVRLVEVPIEEAMPYMEYSIQHAGSLAKVMQIHLSDGNDKKLKGYPIDGFSYPKLAPIPSVN